jgi:hypothetical protein
MAFQEIGGLTKFRAFEKWAVGDYVDGVYSDTGTNKWGGLDRVIKVESCSFTKKDEELPVGTMLRLNYNGSLDYRFKQTDAEGNPKIVFGDRVRITYGGMDKVSNPKNPNCGKDSHQVKVEVDKGVVTNTPVVQSEALPQGNAGDIDVQF